MATGTGASNSAWCDGAGHRSSSSTTSPCATSLSQADDLYELVTARATKTSIFMANRQASNWYTLFPNPVVAESIPIAS